MEFTFRRQKPMPVAPEPSSSVSLPAGMSFTSQLFHRINPPVPVPAWLGEPTDESNALYSVQLFTRRERFVRWVRRLLMF